MTGYEKNSINSAMRAVQVNLILVMVIILIAVMVAFFFVMNDLVNIKIMQTDTLNQLMDLRQELDELKETDQALAAYYPLTEEEKDLVERVVAAEARGEDLIGQEAVAQVILDRAIMWKLSPAEVVQAQGQFADPYQGNIPQETRIAVSNVFNLGVRVFDQPVTHFAAGNPYWAKEKVNRGSIGVHSFYY